MGQAVVLYSFDGNDINIQNPLPTNDGIVDRTNIRVEDSVTTGWTDKDSNGSQIALIPFVDLHDRIEFTGTTNPKELLIHFERSVIANAIGLGCTGGGNFSNIKIEILNSGGILTEVFDGTSDDTKYTSRQIQFPINPGFNAIKLSFLTTDDVTLSNIAILRVVNVVSRLQATKPDNTVVDINATVGGNLKFSLEEFEKETFYSNPLPIKDFRIIEAINIINSTYGDSVSITEKSKGLIKWGRNEEVGTSSTTIMTLPSGLTDETFVSDNLITHVASGSTSDTQELVVEGHILSGTDLVFTTQTVTLAGQTKTALTTPLYRVSRVYNNDTTELIGPVYVAEDVTFSAGVPQTNTAIHLTVPTGEQQSEKASTSISYQDYWIVSSFNLSVLEKVAAFASGRIEVRLFGKIFRPTGPYVAAASGDTTVYHFDPYLIIPKNSDVRLRAVANTSGVDISGGIQGYLATIV